MCIKIIDDVGERSYDTRVPLEQQALGSREIVINYRPQDPEIGVFLSEVKRICNTGIDCKLNINLIHNNNLNGMRAKKTLAKASKDAVVNDIIKMMVSIHHNADKELAELSELCANK